LETGTTEADLMNPRLRLALVTLLAGCGFLTGCVERRFVITTDPPGATVYNEKDMPMGGFGKSPTDQGFIYYGDYEFKLIRDGYETMVVREKVRAPFYEWFLFDFFSENVLPFTLRDVRRFHYQLQPKQMVPPDTVLQKASALRQRGMGIGVPLPEPSPGPGPVSSTLMPPVP
jgi:hypothetical protein